MEYVDPDGNPMEQEGILKELGWTYDAQQFTYEFTRNESATLPNHAQKGLRLFTFSNNDLQFGWGGHAFGLLTDGIEAITSSAPR